MSYLKDVVVIGGGGGAPQNFTGTDNGATLKKIWVWIHDRRVKAMKFWLTDDRSTQWGNPNGAFSEFIFKDGEQFTSLSLWARNDGTRLGAIKFKTTNAREFFAGLSSSELQREVPVDVASGICMGVKGGAGADVDRIGFVFINTVKSTKLVDVEYPTLHQEIPRVAVREIKSMTYENNTSVDQEYKIETSKTVTTKSSWSVTGRLEFTFKMEVSAGLPGIVEVNTGYEFKVGIESTYASENTTEKSELFSFPVKVPPGKIMDVDITIGEAKFDLPFKGTVQITCYNGSVLKYKTSGTYKGVSYTDAKVSVVESAKKLA